MPERTAPERNVWNACRYRSGGRRGHYESYFQRANHPDRALAFWIRYTVFAPRGRPHDALGELWAVHFDGEAGVVKAVKEVVPIGRCRFSSRGLEVRIGEATLDGETLEGDVSSATQRIGWSLRYSCPEPPLLFLPRAFYRSPLPSAKALVGAPNAVFHGSLTVDGEQHAVDDWVGSQNHNWGSKHTDAYAWGQVAGFDGVPRSFFECSTARVRVGPVWSPALTLMVLRLDGIEYRLNTPAHLARASGRYDFPRWDFEARDEQIELVGSITASRSSFVGLPYDNPPGGRKTCLNTKIARCELGVQLAGQPPRKLVSERRAAFEILTDRLDHGVRVLEA